MKKLFAGHMEKLRIDMEPLFNKYQCEQLVIDCGSELYKFQDDQTYPFVKSPYFSYWCPGKGYGHSLLIRPGRKPRLLQHIPVDFWYDPDPMDEHFWQDQFDIEVLESEELIWKEVESSKTKSTYYLGPRESKAVEIGLAPLPDKMLANMNWNRAIKSDYEIECLHLATVSAARGHMAVRKGFENGLTELELHHEFLSAVAALEESLPYPTIIGYDQKAAILHYHAKRNYKGRVLLIDAGASVHGYGSDITRTLVKAQECPQELLEMFECVDKLQLKLAGKAVVGASFTELHKECVSSIGQVLVDSGVLQGVSKESIEEMGLARQFFPHGLGHMLGVCVHDVAGKQVHPDGEAPQNSQQDPYLRTNRVLRENEVVTVEPGLYFIPVLLEKLRKTDKGKYVDWNLIDKLYPFGGIRIEDNVVVKNKESRNLTREHLDSQLRY